MFEVVTGNNLAGWEFTKFKIGAGKLSNEINAEETQMIIVDGEELLSVIRQFSNIPLFSSYEETNWYGDTARFIVGNIKL